MLVITGEDVINFMPVIEEYSGYDRDNTVFDKYITATSIELGNSLLVEGIDYSEDIIQDSPLYKELYLKTLVCKYYNETSYNVEPDERFINFLCSEQKSFLNSFIKSVKDDGEPSTFDGQISVRFSG